jgi:altronate dehydratase large subunit
MDTPFFSPESITAMVAGGAQLVIFTTGPGNSYGSLIAPTVKVCANPEACGRLTEQIDVALDAAVAQDLDGESLGSTILDRVAAVASGSLTYSEVLGEGLEVVSRLGPSL